MVEDNAPPVNPASILTEHPSGSSAPLQTHGEHRGSEVPPRGTAMMTPPVTPPLITTPTTKPPIESLSFPLTSSSTESIPASATTPKRATQPVPSSPTPLRRTPSKQHIHKPSSGNTPHHHHVAPPPDGTILELTIMTLSQRQANVKILATRTLDELGQRVESLLGIPRSAMRFRKNGVDIPPRSATSDPSYIAALILERPLWRYGICSGDVLLIYLDANAGAGSSTSLGVSSMTSTPRGSSSPFSALAAAAAPPQPSPFRDGVSLLPPGTPQKRAPPSPYKEIPSWLRDGSAGR